MAETSDWNNTNGTTIFKLWLWIRQAFRNQSGPMSVSPRPIQILYNCSMEHISILPLGNVLSLFWVWHCAIIYIWFFYRLPLAEQVFTKAKFANNDVSPQHESIASLNNKLYTFLAKNHNLTFFLQCRNILNSQWNSSMKKNSSVGIEWLISVGAQHGHE